MPTVLCFGDSNTWGYDPAEPGRRYPRDVRWPGRLARALGDGWWVIEEGLNGRTTTLDNPTSPGRNGLTYLLPCLHSHAPLDVVVIFLGTNDLADRYSMPPCDVASAAGWLVEVARTSGAGPGETAPQVLLVCPPPFSPTDPEGSYAGSPAKSVTLGRWFAETAALVGCPLLDLAGIARYSELDGIHLDEAGHAAVAAAVEERLRALVA